MAVDAGAADQPVSRVMGAVGAVCATVATIVGLANGGTAYAAPPEDQQASCVYTLSKPFVVEMAGRNMVSATLASLPCVGDILPNQQTVCVQLDGSPAAARCDTKAGYTPAQVYFDIYRLGATYVSTGSGCAAIAPSQVSVCSTQGPLSATL